MDLIGRVIAKAAYLHGRRSKDALRDPESVARVDSRSLLFHYGNVHSQRGQDGILAEIFRRLGVPAGRFVEFGAWDGVHLSNCRFLHEKGWHGVFVEADAKRFRRLTRNYAGSSTCKLIHERVGAPRQGLPGSPLNAILEKSGIDPASVTLVAIDVDGPDLEIFLDLGFSPPVVLLEGGFNLAPDYDVEIPRDVAWGNIQQPLAVIVRSALERGYQPVCFFQDTFLVRRDLARPFEDRKSDAMSLYREAYHFMTAGHRESLLQLRSGSEPIRRLETARFGRFSVDPLAYSP